ncbi:MAG: hypothetical protein OXU67_04950 [Chloroflexota bacterium]|nr:hypothetical protein [Chloroflexota bacterium]
METPTPGLERVQEVRLLALLHDLVRQEGRTGAAGVLGVHRKTVAAAVNTGRLSRRMQDALGLHLLAGPGPDAATESAEERLRELELALIGAYHLTLPPATYPWDALTRRNEVQWRRRTLARVRGERRRAAWRRRLCRILTLELG